MFKICVVGCGAMAKSGHGPSFKKYAQEHENTCLAACCDVNEEAAKKFAENFGFLRYYTDYEKMLDKENPDVVSLLVPVHLTSPMAVNIINCGYNIILEKPPGLNRGEILAIHEAQAKAGVCVRTAFNRRYTPLVQKLKQLLEGEKIRNITYQMYRKGRSEPDFATTAIHAIDAVSFVGGGEYEKINFNYQEIPEAGENVANYYLSGTLDGGVAVQIALVPMGGTISERISVNTDRATYFVELPFWKNCDSPGRLLRVDGATVTHDISGDELVDSTEMYEESGFYEENRGFFEYLREKGEVTSDILSGIQPVEIADYLRKRKTEYKK